MLVPQELQAVMSLLEDHDKVQELRQVRDYMSHRDVRRYYDVGRLAVAVVGVTWHRNLESAFAEMLLSALRASRAERDSGDTG